MGFKGIYKDQSSVIKFGILLVLMLVSLILHTLLALALIFFFSSDGIILIQNKDLTNQVAVNYLKLMQLFSGIGLFITPTLLYSYLTGIDFKFASITRQNTILIIAIMMLITPFVGLLLEWNMKIPFPEWILLFDKNSKPTGFPILECNLFINCINRLYSIISFSDHIHFKLSYFGSVASSYHHSKGSVSAKL